MKSIVLAWNKVSNPTFDTIPPILSNRYFSSLDGLRAISILLVIASHVLYRGPYEFLANGHTGVSIFFAISGFLITTLLLKEKVATQEISLQRFYIRRFLRIFPVAYLYLLVLIPIDIAFHLHISGTNFATAFLYVKNLTMFGTHNWQTGHFWSLAVEEQFYLIFPFILKYAYKVYIRLIIVLIVIIPFSNILFYHPPGIFLHPAPHAVLSFFVDLLGSGTSSFVVLNNKWIRHIGVLSYSLYIWQQLFTYDRPWAHAFRYANSALLNLLVLSAVAYVSYHYFEKRFLVLKDRFKAKESKGSSPRTPGTQTDQPPYSIVL